MNVPIGTRLSDVMHVARLRGASDLHISPEAPVMLRRDSVLEAIPGSGFTAAALDELTQALLGERSWTHLNATGDAGETVCAPDFGTVRVHAFRSKDGIALACRLLPHAIPPLEALRLPPFVGGLAARTRGLILVAGPTGSGKSTTLAALVDRINASSARRIITVEDPIEYRHVSRRSLITQREIGIDAPDFSSALRGALRSDPDVLVIGEMRDADTIASALTAAETGHLVLSTLHAGDAAQSVDRIVDAFPDASQSQVRSQLSQSLVAVVVQRLVCQANDSGRRAAVEVLVGTDAVRHLIRDGKSHQLKNAIALGRTAGMQTLESHLNELIAAREVSLAAAACATDRPQELRDVVPAG